MEPQVKPAENGELMFAEYAQSGFNGAASRTCGKRREAETLVVCSFQGPIARISHSANYRPEKHLDRDLTSGTFKSLRGIP